MLKGDFAGRGARTRYHRRAEGYACSIGRGILRRLDRCCRRKQIADSNEMTAILEETYSTTARGVADYNLRLFEIARAQISAVFAVQGLREADGETRRVGNYLV